MDSNQMMQGAPPDAQPSVAPPQDPTDPSQAPITPDHLQELHSLLGLVKQGYGKWNAVKFSTENQAEAARIEALKSVFQMLLSKGVNLQDPKSVSTFLMQIKQQQPDMYPAIENALDYLLGANTDESPTQSTQAAGPDAQGSPETPPAPQAV